MGKKSKKVVLNEDQVEQVNLWQQLLVDAIGNEMPKEEFEQLIESMPSDIQKPLFLQGLFLKCLLNTACTDYIEVILEKNFDVSLFGVDIEGKSFLACLCDDVEKYREIIAQVVGFYYSDMRSKQQELLDDTVENDPRLSALLEENDHEDENVTYEIKEEVREQLLVPPKQKQSIFTLEQLRQMVELSEPKLSFDQRLFPLINHNLLVDNSILDMLLSLLRSKLAEKTVAVQATHNHQYPITLQQLADISSLDTEQIHTVGVEIEGNTITPIIGTHRLQQEVQYIFIPVNSGLHYGVMLLDMGSEDGASATQGTYFEPYQLQSLLTSIYISSSDSQKRAFRAIPNEESEKFANQWMFFNYLKKLIQTELQMDSETMHFIHLDQQIGTNFCSDWVFAVALCLATRQVNLSDQDALKDMFKSVSLDENMVKGIRMLAIQLAGGDYLLQQLAQNYQTEEMRAAITVYLQSQQQDFSAIADELKRIAERPKAQFPFWSSANSAAKAAPQPTEFLSLQRCHAQRSDSPSEEDNGSDEKIKRSRRDGVEVDENTIPSAYLFQPVSFSDESDKNEYNTVIIGNIGGGHS